MTTKNNKAIIIPDNLISEPKELFGPEDDLQIVMKGCIPVSVTISMKEFDRMTSTIATAEELFEGKDLFMPDGKKVTFQEMVDERIRLERIEHEADLASMFEDGCCEKGCYQKDVEEKHN
jgi:hypothetical protein